MHEPERIPEAPRSPAGVPARARRVALLGPFPPIRSGIARHTESIARAFAAREGTEVKRWGFRRQYPAWLYPGTSERDPEAVRAPGPVTASLDGDNPLTWRRTARQIADWGPDLVVLPAWTFALAPALGWITRRLAARGVEVCVVVHNAFDHESARWKDRLTTWQLGAASRFVTHNRALAEAVTARFPAKPVAVFPHPTFDDFPEAQGSLPRRREIELLFFGLVRPYKGLDTLLDAMESVERHDIALTIAGEFWQGLDETRARIGQLGDRNLVELIPKYLSDAEAAELFHRADAVVMPYRAVSGSGVVSNACHYGRGIIASDLPGFAEVIRHGETGWLFDAGVAAALAATIDGLDRGQLQRAGDAAKALGASLTWARFADVIAGDDRS